MSDFCFRGEIEFTRLPDDIEVLMDGLDNLEGAYGDAPEVSKHLTDFKLWLEVETADYANADATVFKYLREHQHLMFPVCLECWDDTEASSFDDPRWPIYFGPESGRADAIADYYLERALDYVRMGRPNKSLLNNFIKKIRSI